jgi:hypothetical protein
MFGGFPFAGPYFGQGPGLITEPPDMLRLVGLQVRTAYVANLMISEASIRGVIVQSASLVGLKVEP